MSPGDLTPIERSIYATYCSNRGQAAADRWLLGYLAKKRGETLSTSRRTHREPPAAWRDRTTDRLLADARGREVYGQEALGLAERVIGPEWRVRLGCAYPLVLLMVKSALEAGHRPGDEGDDRYHAFSTYPCLGVLCALLVERDWSYTTKTLQRWLDPKAAHAAALRCWLGWRHWMTDTLLEYRTGVNPSTEEPYPTGESRGPVVGGTLFRVRLTPLTNLDETRLGRCNKERPSVIQPLRLELERSWRDLENDRHRGRTWSGEERSLPLEELDVRIDWRTKDQKEASLVFTDNGKTHEPALQNLLHQSYVYPDISTEAGAIRLRLDVENTALWLLHCIEGEVSEERAHEARGRYLHAVWTAYKAERYGGSRDGFRLLLEAKRLAVALRRELGHTVRDVPAFVWSVVERKGFAELRRDYSYERGRYLRVFSGGMARRIGVGC